jgi:hypothetical protein
LGQITSRPATFSQPELHAGGPQRILFRVIPRSWLAVEAFLQQWLGSRIVTLGTGQSAQIDQRPCDPTF